MLKNWIVGQSTTSYYMVNEKSKSFGYFWSVLKIYFNLNVEAEIQILKVIFHRSVGKSSLAIQFVQGQFVDYYEPTIENTFNKTINIKGIVTSVVESEETEVDCGPQFQIVSLFC